MFDAFELFFYFQEYSAYLVSENLMLRPKSCVVVG